MELSLSAARALAIAAQGLDRLPAAARKDDVLAAVRGMGALQIDTISVVARSPYLVLWSRLGAYDPAWLDELLAEGRLFECWAHEACLLPVEDYPLLRRRMLEAGSMGWKYSQAWMDGHADVVARVRDRIRAEGPLKSAAFARTDGGASGWWEWKPEKRALEMLFSSGELMVARRERFQRVYDLRERVLPSWDDARLPTEAAAHRQLVAQAVRALGVARGAWIADYYRMDARQVAAVLPGLVADGTLADARIAGLGPAYIHAELLPLARKAARGTLRPSRTVLLSPFDPLVWDRRRARELFGFDYRLECYTPEAKRRYGYFVLPILRGTGIVGRLDAKAHRSDGVFEVKRIWLEEGVAPSAGLARDLAEMLQACAAWHGTPKVRVRRSAPPAFAAALRAALRPSPPRPARRRAA